MENRPQDIIRLEEKIDDVREKVHSVEIKLVENLSHINTSIQENDANLKIHMKRSDTLERQVNLMESEIKPILQSFAGLKKVFAVLGAVVILLNLVNLCLSLFSRFF